MPLSNNNSHGKGNAFSSVNATVNEKAIFTSVDVSWPGSVHDSRLFKNSYIYPLLKGLENRVYLLGDAGYGITPFLMTPFENALTELEKNFNNKHAKSSVIVEYAFGQLKIRFPILRYGVRIKPEMIATCFTACFILHNIAKNLNDPDFDGEDVKENDEEIVPVIKEENEQQLRLLGQQRRNEAALAILN
ncbi:uncharacterized protein LOC136074544 [Hydra vulgaris]|uniref:Uncharacterized protein LOC136074544 n=1 Tax=Hydra vulgaris TaxID=6087 RepID=A0ABM4B2C0_HYDVU